jgi:SOS response associated peptidase (SRAP)
MIEEYFDTVSDDDWTPRYNIAPTQSVPVIRQNSNELRRELSLLRWGLIPSGQKTHQLLSRRLTQDRKQRRRKPAFRDPLTNRRCLIPADGFYEWVRRGKAKQPSCFEVNNGELFAFAGLWGSMEIPLPYAEGLHVVVERADIHHPFTTTGEDNTYFPRGVASQFGAGLGVQRVHFAVIRADINNSIHHRGRGLHFAAGLVAPLLVSSAGVHLCYTIRTLSAKDDFGN